MYNFLGKNAIVIGGSGGIGASISLMLAELGSNVIVHGSLESEKLDLLLDEMKKKSPNKNVKHGSLIQSFSINDFSVIKKSPLMEAVSKCDILCVCYGPFVQKPLNETTFEDWQTVALLDYALPGICVSAALENMKKNQWGRILLMGGTRTHNISAFRTNAAYAGAKTGVCSLVKSVAEFYAADGITCNAILPGFVDTEYQSEELKEMLAKKMPTGKIISKESVAKIAKVLISSQEINGTLFTLDSGWHPSYVSY